MDLVLPPRSWSTTYDPINMFKYKTILVSANVTEAVSDITQSDKTEISVARQRYQLKFLSATSSSFKPGLTYTGFVSVQQLRDISFMKQYFSDCMSYPKSPSVLHVSG